ncbi:unnamed protein product [Blepharisma stoltei]|uniref:Uncharacterized protein n=1 Tax=Blepharisma stoltei TaxID=1481888 RepID=A0AAU9JCM9_9CILI|nr:unnamed protein product [Blepharisma stoltei]
MGEKLEPIIKSAISANLPAGWIYHYLQPIIVISTTQHLPKLSLVRAFYENFENQNTFVHDDYNFLLVFKGSSLQYWKSSNEAILTTKLFCKGFIYTFMLYFKINEDLTEQNTALYNDYDLATKVLGQIYFKLKNTKF